MPASKGRPVFAKARLFDPDRHWKRELSSGNWKKPASCEGPIHLGLLLSTWSQRWTALGAHVEFGHNRNCNLVSCDLFTNVSGYCLETLCVMLLIYRLSWRVLNSKRGPTETLINCKTEYRTCNYILYLWRKKLNQEKFCLEWTRAKLFANIRTESASYNISQQFLHVKQYSK